MGTDTMPRMSSGFRSVPRGVPITDAELRIIEFLMTSDVTRPADLPDWMLALLQGDRPEELSHKLISEIAYSYFSFPTVSITGWPLKSSFDFNANPLSKAWYSNGPSPNGSLMSLSVSGPTRTTAIAALNRAI